jgi:hypothetical protein
LATIIVEVGWEVKMCVRRKYAQSVSECMRLWMGMVTGLGRGRVVDGLAKGVRVSMEEADNGRSVVPLVIGKSTSERVAMIVR